jgi:cell wall-associated NlpC family hydrolase
MTEIEEQFVAKALQWTADRVKYRHRGITRAGCDCTGLLIGIARECGYLKNYELRDYGRQWNTHAEVPKSETGPGKIVVMRFKLCPAHVGIIVNDNLLMVQIHAKAKYCKATPLRNSPWSARWIATYELNETKMKNYV